MYALTDDGVSSTTRDQEDLTRGVDNDIELYKKFTLMINIDEQWTQTHLNMKELELVTTSNK